METPSFAKVMNKTGIDFKGAYDPESVVRDLIASLPDGPTRIFGFGPAADTMPQVEKARRDRVALMIEVSKMFRGEVTGE
jgi:hypothetical protein